MVVVRMRLVLESLKRTGGRLSVMLVERDWWGDLRGKIASTIDRAAKSLETKHTQNEAEEDSDEEEDSDDTSESCFSFDVRVVKTVASKLIK